jgi:hypothetical protein
MRIGVLSVLLVAVSGGCGGREDPVAATSATAPAVSPASPDAAAPLTVASLAQELKIELTPFEEFERFRGGDDAPEVQLLYPREDVRAEDLDEFRVDVSSAFEPGGKLEFRQGKEVLFSSDFAPEDFTTSEEIPAEVRSAKPGQAVTWGYFPEKGKPVTAQFTIVKEDPRLLEQIAKLEERVGTADSYLFTAMRAQLYLNKRLYYAAYKEAQQALLRGSEDATQAFAVIQASLRAMKLHKSALWADLRANFDGVRGRFAR